MVTITLCAYHYSMAYLFQPFTLRELTLRNRIGMSPMCMYSCRDGMATDWHLAHYGSRAAGGAGLILTEATAVEPRGPISPNDLGIWKDEHIPPLRRIADLVRSQGTAAGMQLAHAGRKASTRRPWERHEGAASRVPPEEGGWQPVAPSAVPYSGDYALPSELDADGIGQVVRDFRSAAERALQAGFQTVEVHAAHGYLLHSFHSPLANKRSDSYGGSLENRIRLTRQVIRAVREVWPADWPVLVRISASDWVEGGWTIRDSVAAATFFKQDGADLIDCSSGGTVPEQKLVTGPGYQVQFAEVVRREAGIPAAAVGRITEPRQAEEYLEQGRCDMVLLGRELLRDPYWPIHAANELTGLNSGPIPVQYQRGRYYPN